MSTFKVSRYSGSKITFSKKSNFHIILVLVVAALYATSQLGACLKDLYYLPVGAENLDIKSGAP